MTIIKHELKQGRVAFFIWTISIALLMVICISLFPEIQSEMDAVGNVFSSMGSFTDAFAMDQLNIATLTGFYAIECGNVLGLGGAFFASLIGIAALSKEEKEHTAEFLLMHPVSRTRIVTEKLAAVIIQIIGMNLMILTVSLIAMRLIGETIPWKEILLMHIAYLFMQLELAGICFGISAFLRRGSVGIGLGLAALVYFLNLIANMTKNMEYLKYITPFGYCEGADIIADGKLKLHLILIGISYLLAGIFAAYLKYRKKDIK